MDEILQTTLLEYDKSTFLLDLVKHSNGKLYVSMLQTIQLGRDNYETHIIKINPTILPDIIEVLGQYREELPIEKPPFNSYYSTERIHEILKRYMNGGVQIKELAMQFNCSETIIEQILRNKGIVIVSNVVPKKAKYWRRKKRQ